MLRHIGIMALTYLISSVEAGLHQRGLSHKICCVVVTIISH